jgi:hypothetical protein
MVYRMKSANLHSFDSLDSWFAPQPAFENEDEDEDEYDAST